VNEGVAGRCFHSRFIRIHHKSVVDAVGSGYSAGDALGRDDTLVVLENEM